MVRDFCDRFRTLILSVPRRQYRPRCIDASVATVVGPRGLICINLSGLSCLPLQRTPDSGTTGIGCILYPRSPALSRFIKCSPHSHPVVCEEDGPKWSATRREEQCS